MYFRHISLVPALSSMGWNTNRGASLREKEGEGEEEKNLRFFTKIGFDLCQRRRLCVLIVSLQHKHRTEFIGKNNCIRARWLVRVTFLTSLPPCCDSTCPHTASLHGGKKNYVFIIADAINECRVILWKLHILLPQNQWCECDKR